MNERLKILLGLPLALLSALAMADGTLDVREVAAGVYVHQGVTAMPDKTNRGEIANIGFIVGERCVAVIDSGGSPDQGRMLKQAIEARTKTPICYVINTHVHPDHIHGNIVFKQAGVSFVGHHKLAQAMALRAGFYLEKADRDAGVKLNPADYVPPDLSVETTRELDLGGRKLLLTAHGPAHSDSDLSVFDDKTQTLWLADLLFMDHIPVIDGSLNGWLKELDALKKVQAARAIPGHGPVTSDWPQAAEAERRYLEALRAQLRSYIKQGKTMEQAMAEVGQGTAGEWRLFDDFHKRNVSTAFAELEWEDN